MRITRSMITSAVWLVASTALAQTPPATPQASDAVAAPTKVGQADFGFGGTAYGADSDQARPQRYRDLRTGPLLDAFKFGQANERWSFDVRADRVGYRDQRYVADYNNFGRLKATIKFDQIPVFFSRDTSTLFTSSSPGVLLLPDGIQSGLENKTTTLAGVAGQAVPFDLRLKRSIADIRVVYGARPNLDLSLSFRNTQKTGGQPWAGTFGFSDAVELAAPVDTRTTEFGAAADWTEDHGSLRLGYDSSMFHDNIGTLVWDNPLHLADSLAGPGRGRMALWPSSNLNAASLSGLVKLPASSQATAYVSLGNWSQDDTLIPFTVNAALPPIALDRPTADARARVTSTAFSLNSRPVPRLWLNARFRSYDFDNRTPVFHVANTVAYDTNVSAFAEGGTSPYSFTRRTVDLDASWMPIAHAALRAGYTHEGVDQTRRTFDTTTEHTVRLSADATDLGWLTVRGVYEHASRVGSGLDEQTLDDIGEQVSLRQFDISDRNSNRFSGIAILTPLSALSFNVTGFVGREERPGAVFGLRTNNNNGGSVGVDYVPYDAVSVGASYEYEKYAAVQASRQANPGVQFTDATRDWSTDSDDRAHTFTASMDLLKLWPKTDVRVAYDFSRAESVYVYQLAANTTLPAVSQLPPVRNTRHRLSADVRYSLSRHLAVGLVDWYEKYDVVDFALNPSTLNSIAQPSFLALGYLYRPYSANALSARLTYLW
jgi:MtrB/PioB family decaheme-associated outer membrane protein